MERKLTTIFCADVVGYSKMMSINEEETLRTLSECRTIIDKLIDESNLSVNEMLKRSALNKLSDSERDLLGLK